MAAEFRGGAGGGRWAQLETQPDVVRHANSRDASCVKRTFGRHVLSADIAATRRYNATVPAMAVDVERLQVDDIGNWLRAWQFMEACGFVAGEAGDQAKPVHRRRRSDLEGAPGTA